MYHERKRCVEWLTPEQAKTLLGELPDHQRDLVLFALATGLRQSNVTGLEWSQVDLERRVAWIRPGQAKARSAIHVSLNSLACNVLRRQQGKHEVRVFTYQGKPVKWGNTRAWRLALKRAGDQRFSLGLAAPHLGIMACAKRNADECVAGNERLGIGFNGEKLCSPLSRTVCRGGGDGHQDAR
jgi:hypothetical protein